MWSNSSNPSIYRNSYPTNPNATPPADANPGATTVNINTTTTNVIFAHQQTGPQYPELPTAGNRLLQEYYTQQPPEPAYIPSHQFASQLVFGQSQPQLQPNYVHFGSNYSQPTVHEPSSVSTTTIHNLHNPPYSMDPDNLHPNVSTFSATARPLVGSHSGAQQASTLSNIHSTALSGLTETGPTLENIGTLAESRLRFDSKEEGWRVIVAACKMGLHTLAAVVLQMPSLRPANSQYEILRASLWYGIITASRGATAEAVAALSLLRLPMNRSEMAYLPAIVANLPKIWPQDLQPYKALCLHRLGEWLTQTKFTDIPEFAELSRYAPGSHSLSVGQHAITAEMLENTATPKLPLARRYPDTHTETTLPSVQTTGKRNRSDDSGGGLRQYYERNPPATYHDKQFAQTQQQSSASGTTSQAEWQFLQIPYPIDASLPMTMQNTQINPALMAVPYQQSAQIPQQSPASGTTNQAKWQHLQIPQFQPNASMQATMQHTQTNPTPVQVPYPATPKKDLEYCIQIHNAAGIITAWEKIAKLPETDRAVIFDRDMRTAIVQGFHQAMQKLSTPHIRTYGLLLKKLKYSSDEIYDILMQRSENAPSSLCVMLRTDASEDAIAAFHDVFSQFSLNQQQTFQVLSAPDENGSPGTIYITGEGRTLVRMAFSSLVKSQEILTEGDVNRLLNRQ
ncbi:MAG TPA: hypothetical protein VK832_05455 [Burkholderiaceae bacterium]|nr:hypothetical protein [Burkholderiaceae bacterium]